MNKKFSLIIALSLAISLCACELRESAGDMDVDSELSITETAFADTYLITSDEEAEEETTSDSTGENITTASVSSIPTVPKESEEQTYIFTTNAYTFTEPIITGPEHLVNHAGKAIRWGMSKDEVAKLEKDYTIEESESYYDPVNYNYESYSYYKIKNVSLGSLEVNLMTYVFNEKGQLISIVYDMSLPNCYCKEHPDATDYNDYCYKNKEQYLKSINTSAAILNDMLGTTAKKYINGLYREPDDNSILDRTSDNSLFDSSYDYNELAPVVEVWKTENTSACVDFMPAQFDTPCCILTVEISSENFS